MKCKLSFIGGCILSVFAAAMPARAQSGAILALSRDLQGTVTNNSVRPGGCATLVCTTNMVTVSECFTNYEWKLVCTTNSATGQVQCTNVLVTQVRCFTNTFPEITCSNVFTAPTKVIVSQHLSGGLGVGPCDELGALFPSTAVLQASLYTTLRTNDWRGFHFGSFKILDGTNVVAYGGLNGINGAGTHRGSEPCASCNHLEGTLRGTIVTPGPLQWATIQAAYAGNIGVPCPSPAVPQGAIILGIEGAVVTPCPSVFGGGFFQPTSTTAQ